MKDRIGVPGGGKPLSGSFYNPWEPRSLLGMDQTHTRQELATEPSSHLKSPQLRRAPQCSSPAPGSRLSHNLLSPKKAQRGGHCLAATLPVFGSWSARFLPSWTPAISLTLQTWGFSGTFVYPDILCPLTLQQAQLSGEVALNEPGLATPRSPQAPLGEASWGSQGRPAPTPQPFHSAHPSPPQTLTWVWLWPGTVPGSAGPSLPSSPRARCEPKLAVWALAGGRGLRGGAGEQVRLVWAGGAARLGLGQCREPYQLLRMNYLPASGLRAALGCFPVHTRAATPVLQQVGESGQALTRGRPAMGTQT